MDLRGEGSPICIVLTFTYSEGEKILGLIQWQQDCTRP